MLYLGETIVREYTPVVKFDKDENHRLMLMVKLYPHGKMTQYLSTIKAGIYMYFLNHFM